MDVPLEQIVLKGQFGGGVYGVRMGSGFYTCISVVFCGEHVSLAWEEKKT